MLLCEPTPFTAYSWPAWASLALLSGSQTLSMRINDYCVKALRQSGD